MRELDDILGGLNDAQREAPLALRGPAEILAGAKHGGVAGGQHPRDHGGRTVEPSVPPS